MFYEPVHEHEGYTLVRRPDTKNLSIAWYSVATGRYRRQTTGTSDPEEGLRRLKAFVRERTRPVAETPDRADLLGLIEVHATRIIERGGSPHAPRAALRHWREFIEVFELRTVADLTYLMQERYVVWRRERLRAQGLRASNGTIKRELGIVKAALKQAWKRGTLTAAPHVLSLPTPPPRERFLRQDEIARLLHACMTPHLRLYVMLALATLQRPIALLSLRTEQVHLDAGLIDFNAPGRVQSNKKRPVVPITAAVKPDLEAAIAGSRTGCIIEYQGRPIRSVRQAFASACERAGLEDVTPYVLRHTGATLLAASGVPLRQIAGILGHTEQRTTELYAKHHPDFLRDARDTLDAVLHQAMSTHL